MNCPSQASLVPAPAYSMDKIVIEVEGRMKAKRRPINKRKKKKRN